MKRAALLSLLLVACSHANATRIRGPEGGEGRYYEIHCNRDPSYCRAKAEEVCEDGYTVTDRSDQSGAYAQRIGYGVYATPVYNGSIVIRCH